MLEDAGRVDVIEVGISFTGLLLRIYVNVDVL